MSDPNADCYGLQGFQETAPWPYGHVRIGFIHQILVHNFVIALLLHYLNETLEVILVTVFVSYVFFPQANTHFENMTDSLMGDILQGCLGIILAIIIQRYVTYIPRLIVYIEDDLGLSVITWAVLLLIFGPVGQLAGLNFTLGGQTFNYGVLITMFFDILLFYLIIIWGVFGEKYDRIVWGVGSARIQDKRRAKWRAFWAITVIILLLSLPAVLVNVSTYYKMWVVFYFVVIIVLAASLSKRTIHFSWPKRYYGGE